MIENMFLLKKIINNALAEDIGSGDITTENIFCKKEIGCGKIIAKEKGMIAGLPVAKMVFMELDSNLRWEQFVTDGHKVSPGTPIAEITGKLQAILTGERVALNFLQRLSAIATKTSSFVEKAAKYNVKILDTRKTTPGLRILEKYAVRIGGATNHRFGLYDAAILKDNHIKGAGGITNAVAMLRARLPVTAKIEVEVETVEQIHEALAAKVDIIMLDNMLPEEIRHAVKLIKGRVLVEASGGISEENVESIAATGVNYISIGSLTHSIESLDISLGIQRD